jgi:S-formylglutathione hydrolase FrmB
MLNLTGRPLFTLMVLLAVLVPVIAVVVLNRQPSAATARHAMVARVAGRGALVLLSQLLAMSALFLWVNNQYGFYTSWADLAGRQAQSAQIQTNGLIKAGSGAGSVEVLPVHGAAARTTADTLVWLPPQYRDPRYAHNRFPVVMFLTGQPSTPQAVFKHYSFATIASQEIRTGRIKPFIAVFPPLMTQPPRDTECTNIPGGPQAESWLSSDVPAAVIAHYRTETPGPRWSVMGWSTGGFCAAKLLLHHPQKYAAAVSFGGYYDPLTDSTTGSLFGDSVKLQNENSPRWLYTRHHGLAGGRLLMVTGQQDRYAWRSTQKMLAVSRGDKNVAVLPFATGGHNYRNYRAYLGPALQWLAAAGVTG